MNSENLRKIVDLIEFIDENPEDGREILAQIGTFLNSVKKDGNFAIKNNDNLITKEKDENDIINKPVDYAVYVYGLHDIGENSYGKSYKCTLNKDVIGAVMTRHSKNKKFIYLNKDGSCTLVINSKQLIDLAKKRQTGRGTGQYSSLVIHLTRDEFLSLGEIDDVKTSFLTEDGEDFADYLANNRRERDNLKRIMLPFHKNVVNYSKFDKKFLELILQFYIEEKENGLGGWRYLDGSNHQRLVFLSDGNDLSYIEMIKLGQIISDISFLSLPLSGKKINLVQIDEERKLPICVVEKEYRVFRDADINIDTKNYYSGNLSNRYDQNVLILDLKNNLCSERNLKVVYNYLLKVNIEMCKFWSDWIKREARVLEHYYEDGKVISEYDYRDLKEEKRVMLSFRGKKLLDWVCNTYQKLFNETLIDDNYNSIIDFIENLNCDINDFNIKLAELINYIDNNKLVSKKTK